MILELTGGQYWAKELSPEGWTKHMLVYKMRPCDVEKFACNNVFLPVNLQTPLMFPVSRHFDPDNVELRTICCTTAHNPLKKLVANLRTIVDVNDPFRFKDPMDTSASSFPPIPLFRSVTIRWSITVSGILSTPIRNSGQWQKELTTMTRPGTDRFNSWSLLAVSRTWTPSLTGYDWRT